MPLQGDLGAPDPDRRRRFRRTSLPDVRPITVRQALQRLSPRSAESASVRERDRLEASVRRGLRQT